MNKEGTGAFHSERRKMIHALSTLNKEEFVDLLQSKATQSNQAQPLPGLFLSSPENIFPSLTITKLLLSQRNVYHIFDSSSVSRVLSEKKNLKIARTSISSRITSVGKKNVLLLDWLTIVMAQARRKFFAEYALPRTLYIRPRDTWPRMETEKTRPDPSIFTGTPVNFSRTFQWHLLDSNVFTTEVDKGTPLKVLLAVVTTWNSTTTPPISWGFWTYVRKDGKRQPFTDGDEQYNKEKQAMMLETRLRSFDPQGQYEQSHFTVSAEAYNHLTLGQFIALMFSAEFHRSHYSPFVLDDYVSKYINPMFPDAETGDHSDDIRTMLYGIVPPVNTSIIKTGESPYAFPTLGNMALRSPYSCAITPEGISFEGKEFSELVDVPWRRNQQRTLIIDETYRKKELEDANIVLVIPQTEKKLLFNYPENDFFIKKRPNMKTARDEAIFIKKAHVESSRIPGVAGVYGRRLILEKVGRSIGDYPFPGGFQEWISNEGNKEIFLDDLTEALTALWLQGYIHGDLGTDKPPENVTRLLGDKAANRNITYDGNNYYVIDLDLVDMIPKDTSPRYSIPELARVDYTSDDYPRKQAEQIYKILTS
ncbi:MAG: hypothetical protein ACTSUE_16425 [Promethearchaeota archaeon]